MSLDVWLECEHCGAEIYSDSVTHNLSVMAKKAGIYMHLWKPEKIDVIYAHQLIKPLKYAIRQLRESPAYFEQFNPSNGWGNYEIFLEFVIDYWKACVRNPKLKIYVWI